MLNNSIQPSELRESEIIADTKTNGAVHWELLIRSRLVYTHSVYSRKMWTTIRIKHGNVAYGVFFAAFIVV